jgi:negative regulator of sigma-B (phosphoserine phosphatase)
MNGAVLQIGGNVVSWGVAEAPLASETESGDRCIVEPAEDGVLIAAVDGTGHGPEAAHAARAVAHTIKAFALESPIGLVLRCHERLRLTRGVVMTLAWLQFPTHTLTWLGVGNVEAVLYHTGDEGVTTSERVLLRAGVIGYQLPALRADVLPLRPADTLIMATDGIDPVFAEHVPAGEPQDIAERILTRHRRITDDALVVVARYLGGTA